ncbi:hypothetical protein ACP4OV_002060 [Aristida adscensionis]
MAAAAEDAGKAKPAAPAKGKKRVVRLDVDYVELILAEPPLQPCRFLRGDFIGNIRDPKTREFWSGVHSRMLASRTTTSSGSTAPRATPRSRRASPRTRMMVTRMRMIRAAVARRRSTRRRPA